MTRIDPSYKPPVALPKLTPQQQHDGRANRQALTMIEMSDADIETAEKIGTALGYTQMVYTSTSALWGVFCLRDNAGHRAGCVIRTLELGFMFIQDLEDLNLYEMAQDQYKTK